MIFPNISNIRLCVFIIVISYSIPEIDGTLKSKKILYGLAIAHVLGLLKTQHTTHHVPILIPPKKRCFPKCHKDYHFHEHVNMMSPYSEYDSFSGGSYSSGINGYDDDFSAGDDDDGIYTDEMSSASLSIPKKIKYKIPKYKKIHHYVDNTSFEDDYGASIRSKSSIESKYSDNNDLIENDEIVEDEYIDDSEYETESVSLKPKKKKVWKRYLKKLKLKPKRSLKTKPDSFTSNEDESNDSMPYQEDQIDMSYEKPEQKVTSFKKEQMQSISQGFEHQDSHTESHIDPTITLPNQSKLPSSLLKLNISGDINQLDDELDDITVDKMFSELVKNNPNNKVLEAIQKELESPLRSFLRNTKIAKLIKKHSKSEKFAHSERKTPTNSPIKTVTISTTTSTPETIDQKFLKEAFKPAPVITPLPQASLEQNSVQQTLQHKPPSHVHPAILYGQPMMMPMNTMYHQPHPSLLQMPHQQQQLQMSQSVEQQQYPKHHSMKPYSQLPAADHYLPEESQNVAYKLVPFPEQPILVSRRINGEIIADQTLIPIRENSSKPQQGTKSD